VTDSHVDLTRAGTYEVTYECSNFQGMPADPIVRTVTVYDDSCPICEVSPESAQLTIEASFPFIDHEVLCSDNLDLAPKAARVTGVVDVELSGTYVLTYSATDAAANTNFQLHNGAACNPGLSQKRAVTVMDTLAPVISLRRQNGDHLDGLKKKYTNNMQPVMEQGTSYGMWKWVGLFPVGVGFVALLAAGQRRAPHRRLVAFAKRGER
jgi:hypothetical protein